ncbi:MAG: DUF4270 domain-containing protein [Paludibacteraceae bacterium]|nr:DUF4270 domain-containing protein [Paludibacteraceae bacterium]MBR1480752.1 DUF4270 domain-containing protein [Paludibacteraceae bacterium]
MLPLLLSCQGDSTTTGSSLLTAEDSILVYADTFDIRSQLMPCDNIISSPDSFLLGEIESDYGLVRGELLTQLACPLGFEYPQGAEVDSVCLFLYYRSWQGDGHAPLQLEVRELDLRPLYYTSQYHTDIDIDDYCSMADSTLVSAQPRIVVAQVPTDSVQDGTSGNYYAQVTFRMTDAFTRRFFALRDFSRQEAFDRLFHGLYLRSTFGGSTMLNATDVTMAVYYHFPYTRAGRDTVVHDIKAFYANPEVRQINRIVYEAKEELIAGLTLQSDNNYIIAPAGVYTRLSLPMEQMEQTINGRLERRRPYVNMARVRVNVLNVYDGSQKDITRNDWTQPASRMLLLKQDMLQRFFAERMLPSDTTAILSSLTTSTDSTGNSIHYYDFDISLLLTNQLRHPDNPDTLHMVLVPVDVQTASSSTATAVIGIQQSQTLSTTVIHSAANATDPMNLEVVYSGF